MFFLQLAFLLRRQFKRNGIFSIVEATVTVFDKQKNKKHNFNLTVQNINTIILYL